MFSSTTTTFEPGVSRCDRFMFSAIWVMDTLGSTIPNVDPGLNEVSPIVINQRNVRLTENCTILNRVRHIALNHPKSTRMTGLFLP